VIEKHESESLARIYQRDVYESRSFLIGLTNGFLMNILLTSILYIIVQNWISA